MVVNEMNMVNTYFSEFNSVSIVCRLLVAVICGGIIGLERGKHRQAAGFRTHILVCLGATLVVITNIYLADIYGGDATRIAAQVVNGIGFLGAGTIIVTHNKQIKGLTTAAGLWISACMGLAIGAGFFMLAVVSCILVFLVMTVLSKVERYFYQTSKTMELYIEFIDIKYVSLFIADVRNMDIKTTNLEIAKSKILDEKCTSILITLRLPKQQEHSQILSKIGGLEGIKFIEEI